MKIRIEIEPGDIVRAAQKKHANLSHATAQQVLKRFAASAEHALDDAKASLVRSMVDYALHSEKEKLIAHT